MLKRTKIRFRPLKKLVLERYLINDLKKARKYFMVKESVINMKRIVFVLHIDKFTRGFHKFIISNFTEQENWFVFYGEGGQFVFQTDHRYTFWCRSYKEFHLYPKLLEIVRECDAIIYSGIFGCERSVLKFGFDSLKKSYFQLWGGDYICFRKINQMGLREKLQMKFRKYVLGHAKAVINLLPGEYEELRNLCKVRGEHIVAPVPSDGTTQRLVQQLHDEPKNNDSIVIQIGNSATPTNQHAQIIHMLSRFKRENIKIICPLSYGDMQYAEQVIKLGLETFGEKFVPIREYMSIETYYSLLSSIHVAIFNNNRQQAMANISAALGLGCRVYIRKDTPMWKTYNNRGYFISDIDRIPEMEFSEMIQISAEEKENNFKCYNRASDMSVAIQAWSKVFDSI